MSLYTKPLEGIRVIDLTTFIAGPGAARILADQGADVIKVEPIEGDAYRTSGALFRCPTNEDENPVFDIENANKKLVSINLKTKEGLEIVYKLLEDADVLITNYREKALEKLGLSYETIHEKYPQIVFGHVNSFGQKGKDANLPGYDLVAYFARSGFLLDTVAEGSIPPLNLGGAGDHPTSVALAQGVTAALLRQQRTGKGDKVSVSLYHTAIWTLATLIGATQYSAKYPVPYDEPALSPISGHPYKCADGKWILIMILDFKKYWGPFCKTIQREDLIEDTKFNTPVEIKKNQSQLVKTLSEIIASEPYCVWEEKWKAIDLPFEVLRHMHEVPEDEQAQINEFVFPVEYPSGKKVYLPTTPIQFRERGSLEYKIPSGVGSDTSEVLTALGYSEEIIEKMVNDGIVKAMKQMTCSADCTDESSIS